MIYSLSEAKIIELFSKFSYTDNKDGSITIDPAWVEDNIATLRVPNIKKPIMCHHKIALQLSKALYDIDQKGYTPDIKTYDGCWFGRHKRWDKKAPLSAHSWGIAVDFNASTNPMGKNNDENKRLAEAFEQYGFRWANRWKVPDPMHVEWVGPL